MEDTKKSVIRYEHMFVTPTLLEYLDFEDISLKNFKTMPERSIFQRGGVVVALDITEPRLRKRLRDRFTKNNYYTILFSEGLTLSTLINGMLLLQ
jgi:hypothetical protein